MSAKTLGSRHGPLRFLPPGSPPEPGDLSLQPSSPPTSGSARRCQAGRRRRTAGFLGVGGPPQKRPRNSWIAHLPSPQGIRGRSSRQPGRLGQAIAGSPADAAPGPASSGRGRGRPPGHRAVSGGEAWRPASECPPGPAGDQPEPVSPGRGWPGQGSEALDPIEVSPRAVLLPRHEPVTRAVARRLPVLPRPPALEERRPSAMGTRRR